MAQRNLGEIYSSEDEVPRDYPQAVRWLRAAAERNDPIAQFALGSLYAQGKGVEKDPVMQAHWTEKAAESGHALAQAYTAKITSLAKASPKT